MFVVDRIKDVINTGGVVVASREIEDVLYTHPAIAEVAVIGVPHERWIEAITAVVVLHHDVESEALIAYARERLASHKVPKSMHVVPELPKNASGKLLKRELRRQFASGAVLALTPSVQLWSHNGRAPGGRGRGNVRLSRDPWLAEGP